MPSAAKMDDDVEAGEAGEAGDISPENVQLFLDPDVVIPRDIARPILYTSQIMLITAVLAALAQAWVVFGLALGLWFTSTNFWRDPRISWRRTMDYCMVLVSFSYGTYFAFQLPAFWTVGWCLFLGAIALIFAVNETRFWFNPNRTLRDYQIAVYVHLTGVHLIGNLAVWFILLGYYETHDKS